MKLQIGRFLCCQVSELQILKGGRASTCQIPEVVYLSVARLVPLTVTRLAALTISRLNDYKLTNWMFLMLKAAKLQNDRLLWLSKIRLLQ